MRATIRLGLLSGLALGLLASACGGGKGTTGTASSTAASSTGETATSSTTGASSSASGGTGGMGAGGAGGAGGGGPTLYNNCDPTTAEDHTNDATVTITFGDALMYMPACIRVKSGTMVTFSGSTVTHPLDEGLLHKGVPTSVPNSPIKPTSNFMPTVTFTMAPVGIYGYFCDDHYGVGMEGAIFVE